jgi:hypothetical protein
VMQLLSDLLLHLQELAHHLCLGDDELLLDSHVGRRWRSVSPICTKTIGECWGIREKTLHPRNVGFVEVHEISFRVMCENSSQIWLLRVNLLSISRRLKPAKLLNHEPAKIWNHEPAKIWNHEPTRLRNLGRAKLWVQIPEIRESRMGSSEIRKKPSQRCYLEKSGLDV